METKLNDRMDDLRKSTQLLGWVLLIGGIIGIMVSAWHLKGAFFPEYDYEMEIFLFQSILFFVPAILILIPGLLFLHFSKKSDASYKFKRLKLGYLFITILILIGGAIIGIGGFIYFMEELTRERY